jgi:hypothetical protein
MKSKKRTRSLEIKNMRIITFVRGNMIVTAIVTFLALFLGMMSMQFLGKSNPIEEICEEVIQVETGLRLHLDGEEEEPICEYYQQEMKQSQTHTLHEERRIPLTEPFKLSGDVEHPPL